MNQSLFDEIVDRCRPLSKEGRLASYIPELTKADPDSLGLCLMTPEHMWRAGDSGVRFTIQSIAKLLSLTCCLMDSPLEKIYERVTFEPSYDAFNSIVALENKNGGRPLNPMINAGAIATLSLVEGKTGRDKFERVLDFSRQLTGNKNLNIDQNVYLSEAATGSRNRALGYYMKSTGIIDGDVEELLDAYFRLCSIEMDCLELARAALIYALDGEGHFSKQISRTAKAVLTLCGMYDESGRVAVEIGLPTKSGVGGGILSIVPGKMGIGIYGPALNEKGSSTAGLAALGEIARALDLSIF